ncbi:xanthine dehydrogenase family protein molybdopterin-binding subunit [Actinacidiphila sp. ITFR-21]|uniref:xanthine dehydrogenase family protein molybdopterin-binding subunit n=1 Tax=Actinacidiphila sp. ITFR-21 TaxID=3075199 RepID=UPI00288BD9D8|nr:xanthine dehydrogenase family protein molybdopterin-binding subunit [Streptomyces sp. ITFR-21]WNI17839.1 xanthine dehydrogenase family protein molybdopterin-binding subunit [Streptomyces sp. ITFR-21]
MTAIGTSVLRLEDERLLRGRGRFHDDTVRPGQLWLRVVRSPVAHARIVNVDTSAAEQLPGVVAVVTAADLPGRALIPVRQPHPGIDFTPYLQPPLATGFVRYAGEPVAAVLAEDPYLAEDAADLVVLEFDELPVVLDARAAAGSRLASRPDTPAEVGVVEFGYGDVDALFDTAAHVVSADLSVGRHSGTPLEPRGLVAEYDDRTERLTVWGASKVPYFNRRVLAGMLDLPEHRIHMLESDAGGSFGVRGEFYPEDLLVPMLALRTRRPVKWSEDRTEHMIAANHAREQQHHFELAFDEDHRLLAMRDEGWLDNGGYVRTHGAVVAALTAAMISGPYRLPACRSRIHIVTTNKTPIGTYRAPGRFQHNFVREHVLDVAADRLGADPVELRRRNLLDHTELPFRRPMQIFGAPMLLDGSDHLGHFDTSREEFGYERWRAQARAARESGRLVGAGCAVILEKAGLGHDSAVVDVGVTGAVRVAMGGSGSGQGVETVMAQIVAAEFDIAPDTVKVVLSDTDILPDGAGSFASRTTVVGGTAAKFAAEAVIAKARRVAAVLLGVEPGELVVRGGEMVVAANPEQRVPLGRIATVCFTPQFVRTGEEPGLVGRGTYVADAMTYPYGAHYALTEVDPQTGRVRLLRYAVSYEIGKAVNPRMVHGQIYGGAVQGIGGALLEEFRYDERGIPLSTTFNEYRWPRLSDLPDIQVAVYEDSPAPGNPLGVRGAGEGGTAGVGAAIANAVRDALQLRGHVGSLPLHPERVLGLLRDAPRHV